MIYEIICDTCAGVRIGATDDKAKAGVVIRELQIHNGHDLRFGIGISKTRSAFTKMVDVNDGLALFSQAEAEIHARKSSSQST